MKAQCSLEIEGYVRFGKEHVRSNQKLKIRAGWLCKGDDPLRAVRGYVRASPHAEPCVLWKCQARRQPSRDKPPSVLLHYSLTPHVLKKFTSNFWQLNQNSFRSGITCNLKLEGGCGGGCILF